MARASLADITKVEHHGYRVQRERGYQDGRERDWWTLLDPEGAYLMIDGQGCAVTTQAAAVAEALRRIEQDERLAAEVG